MMLLSSHHSLLLVNFLIGLFWVIGMRLTASSTADLERTLAEAVILAMQNAGMNRKALADEMGIALSTLDNCLNPDRPEQLSLYRLVKARMAFWLHFGPALMFIVFKRRWEEIAQEADRAVQVVRRSA